MTDLLSPESTGEIPPPDRTIRIYTADHTEKILLGHHALVVGQPMILDARPVRWYRDRPETLADTLAGLGSDIPGPDPVPPPPPPTPARALQAPAREYPVVGATYDGRPAPDGYRGEHRAPAPAWTKWCIAVGALLAIASAATLAGLAAIR